MSGKPVLRAVTILGITGFLTCVAVLAWMWFAPRHVPFGQQPLTTLSKATLPSFRETFNASKGKVRVLAMLSPT